MADHVPRWRRPAAALALGAALATGVLVARRATTSRGDSLEAAHLGPPRPPARKPVLLMNLASGDGKAEEVDLPALCRERGIEAVILEEGDDLAALAESHARAGADCLGMAGGDGSQAVVAEVAMRHRLPFVVVPAGTRNHLALDLGLDRDDIVGALDAFAGGVPRTIDLARVNDRVFVNNASLGLYAQVVSSDEYRDAKLRTTLTELPDLLGDDADPSHLEFDAPGAQQVSDAQVVLVANNPYTLDSLDGAGSRARLDTGELGIVSVSLGSTGEARRLLALAPIGEMDRSRGWLEWTARAFEVRSDSGDDLPIALDGEALTMAPPLRFESLPGALVVLIPPHAPGRSPAARARSRRTLREAWQGLVKGG